MRRAPVLMVPPARTMAVMSLLAAVIAAAPAQAVESPLSRASFDRAVAEGRACERLDAQGTYLVARQPASGVMAAVIEDLLQRTLDDAITTSYVTVLLTTPYTEARRAACEAKLFGGAFDVEALWSRLQALSTVWIRVETRGTYECNTTVSCDAAGEPNGPPALPQPVPGPHVESVVLRRGKDVDAVTIPSLQADGMDGYLFPATALQGNGPFYAVIHTTAPADPLTVKLKRSVVKRP